MLIRLANRDFFIEVQLKGHPNLQYMQQLPTHDPKLLKHLGYGTVAELQEALDKNLEHLFHKEHQSVFVQVYI